MFSIASRAVWVICAVLFLAGLAVGSASRSAAEEKLAGDRESISVIDGDTIQVAGTVIQLAGIDAPEIGQVCVHGDQDWHCGPRAAYALHKFIELAADPVICSHLTETPEGILSGTCEAGEENLALTMLKGGYAVVPPGSSYFYKSEEDKARQAGLGLWASKFVLPWDWRAGERLPQEDRWVDRACVILGTVSASGKRVYYVPTDAEFHDIQNSPDRIVRTFCSDEAARAAGWRHPGE